MTQFEEWKLHAKAAAKYALGIARIYVPLGEAERMDRAVEEWFERHSSPSRWPGITLVKTICPRCEAHLLIAPNGGATDLDATQRTEPRPWYFTHRTKP